MLDTDRRAMETTETLLERHLKDDRILIATGIAIVSILAWVHMARMSISTHHLPVAHAMAPLHIGEILSLFLMWIVMMTAMMLPTAAPMILTFSTITRKRMSQNQPYVSTSIFVFGYLMVSVLYSVLAVAAQIWLHGNAYLTVAGASNNSILTGLLLTSAGIYQWTSLKHNCLKKCRSPFDFLMLYWQEGIKGALTMGVRHGIFCTLCCWVLMALMFVAGVMNLFWMMLVTLVILIEKIAPRGDILARVFGVVLGCTGIYFIAQSI